ncbi:MAG: helix-turn-helix domain-containing protein [Syntrophobacterales bacterium]|nr:helix-turn-helix domain-containing protein [Syntrophobacterales bacterium]
MKMDLDLSGRLKFLRTRKKLSQKQLAALIGVTTQTVLKYEKGYRVPTADILNKIIEYLGCEDPAWFLTGQGGKLSVGSNHASTFNLNSRMTEDSKEMKELSSRIMAVAEADEAVFEMLMKMLDANLMLAEEMLSMRRVLSMRREFADRSG